MAPLRTVVNVSEYDRVGADEFEFEKEELDMDDLTSPSEEIDRLARKFMDDHPKYSYSDAVKRVMDDHPDLKVFYANETEGKVRITREMNP